MNRCKKCQEVISSKYEYCISCRDEMSAGHNDKDDGLFIGSCEICGKRGRRIEKLFDKEKRIYYRCFDCNEKEKYEGCFSSKKSKEELVSHYDKYYTPSKLEYDMAMKDHYFKLLFYGEDPDEKKLNELWYRVLKEMESNSSR